MIPGQCTSDGGQKSRRHCFLPGINRKITKAFHDPLHLGPGTTLSLITKIFSGRGLSQTIKRVTYSCALCSVKEPGGKSKTLPTPALNTYSKERHFSRGRLATGLYTAAPFSSYRFILVFIGTFTRWVQAFPTRTEKVVEVAKALLKETLPRFGLS